jgi:hypothetical protein
VVIKFRISKTNRQHNDQKKKIQKEKQRSTKHTHTTKDRVKRTPLKTGGELRWSRMVKYNNHLYLSYIYFQHEGFVCHMLISFSNMKWTKTSGLMNILYLFSLVPFVTFLQVYNKCMSPESTVSMKFLAL